MSQCNILSPASYAALLAGILYGVQKEMQEGGKVTLLLGSIGIILLIFAMSIYATYMKSGSSLMGSDFAVVLRAGCSSLFTTDLFVKNQVIGDKFDYLPLIIFCVLGAVYLMQGGENECDRSFLQLYQILNMVAQLYVACKAGQILTGVAAFSLLMAYSMCTEGDGFMGVSPAVWYNFLAGTYCLTANGKAIELK